MALGQKSAMINERYPWMTLPFSLKVFKFDIYYGLITMFSTDMVKNKGFLPSGTSEISIQRNQMKEIIFSLLPACNEPDPETNVPFIPDAIIANPPAYG